MKIDYKEVILLISFIVIQLISALLTSKILLWDENVYIANARHFTENLPYFEPYRFPLLWWILIPFSTIFKSNFIFYRILIIFLNAFSIVFLYKILKEIDKSDINLLFAFFFILNGIVIFWGNKVYPDLLASTFLLGSIYYYIKYVKTNKEKYLLLYILFGVLSFLSKFYYGLWLFISFLYKRDKKMLFYLVIFLLPWFIYNIILHGNPIWDLIEQAKVAYAWQHNQSILLFLDYLFMYIGFFTLPLFFPKIYKNWERPIYFYTLLTFIYFLFFVKQKDPRYFLTFLPTLIILSKILYKRLEGFRLVLLLIYLFSIGQSFLKGISDTINYSVCWDGTDIISFTLFYLKKHNASMVFSNCCWPWIANYLNIPSYSLWNSNVSAIIKGKNVDYIVISPNYGLNLSYILPSNAKEVAYYEDNCGFSVRIYKIT